VTIHSHTFPTDEDGNPLGGEADGTGFRIVWQHGPLGRGAERREPNGAFVEDVLHVVEQRIQFYQSTKFSCRENALALTHIQEAIHWLEHRTKERERREVEGLNVV